MSAKWGKLSCAILAQDWDSALEELNKLKRDIDETVSIIPRWCSRSFRCRIAQLCYTRLSFKLHSNKDIGHYYNSLFYVGLELLKYSSLHEASP